MVRTLGQRAAGLITLERVAIAVSLVMMMLIMLVGQAHAQVNIDGAGQKIIGYIGVFVLVLSLGYGAMKIGRGSVVPALVIILLGALFYFLTQGGNAKSVFTNVGKWVFSLFGL